ncbi:MAG: hypothetical protein IGS03_00675 [Candidatus Sericytochromatia bacterium]|nr:hypothetical protein [Candidatus Sericytochromatia bacterium]
MAGITVNELITRLTFKQDKAGIKAYEAGLTGISKTAAKVAASSGASFAKMTSQNTRRFGTMGKLMERVMTGSFGKIVSAGSKAFMGLESRFAKLRGTMGKGLSATIKFHGLDKETSRVTALHSKLLGLAALAGGGMTAGAAAKSTFTAGGEYEMQMARLTTLFGEQAAKGLYTQMQQFAAKTPFEMPDIVDFIASTTGAGFNFRKKDGTLNMEELTAIGDQVASSGKKLPEMAQAMIGANRGLANMIDNFFGTAGKVKDGGIETILQDKGKEIKGFIGEDDPNKQEKIKQFFVSAGMREGYAGGMERQSQTLPGKLSTLRDAVKNLQTQFYLGFQGNAHQFLDKLAQFVEKATPKMKELGVQVGIFVKHDLPKYLKVIKELLPWIGTGLAVMYSHMVGITTLKFALWLWKAEAALRAMGFAGMIANAGIFGLPALIGGVVLALAAFGADFVYWFNTGESMILKFTERWPWLHDAIKGVYEGLQIFFIALQMGFENIGAGMANVWQWAKDKLPWAFSALGVAWNIIYIPLKTGLDILKGLWQAIWDGIVGSMRALENMFDWLKKTFPLLEKAGNLLGSIWNYKGEDGVTGTGSGSSRILNSAQNFAIGSPGKSQADRWAKSSDVMDGWKVKQLYISGVACAISSKKVVQNAGATQQVLSNMSASVPETYKKLLASGLAEIVPANQLKGGELFFQKNMQHMGVVGADAKSLIHASNSSGKQIGMGQRFTSTGNYLGGNGLYLRIKDQGFTAMPSANPVPAGGGKGGNSVTVQQTFNVPVQPNAVKRATQDGVTNALNKAAAGKPKPKAVR